VSGRTAADTPRFVATFVTSLPVSPEKFASKTRNGQRREKEIVRYFVSCNNQKACARRSLDQNGNAFGYSGNDPSDRIGERRTFHSFTSFLDSHSFGQLINTVESRSRVLPSLSDSAAVVARDLAYANVQILEVAGTISPLRTSLCRYIHTRVCARVCQDGIAEHVPYHEREPESN